MKKHTLLPFVTILAVTLSFFSCKKNTDKSAPGIPVAIATDRGDAIGTATTKTIGAAGGQLTSADGRISIAVPAGTVSTPTIFSIQPITNKLEPETGKNGYRLLPEGTTFSKNISVTFNYDDLDFENSVEEALMVAYQTEDRKWKAVAANLNATANTLTIKTTHFSDWLITGSLRIAVGDRMLSAGQSTILAVVGFTLVEDMLAPIATQDDIRGEIEEFKNWRVVSGPGTIAAGEATATYSAPATVSQPRNVEVQVELAGDMFVLDSTAPGGRRQLQQVILLTKLRLVGGETFMVGTFGEQEIATTEVSALLVNGKIHISGYTGNGSYYIQANGAGVNDYRCGDLMVPGNSMVNAAYSTSPNSSFSFGSEYRDCGPPEVIRHTEAAVTISEWGAVGQPVAGSFSGVLRMADGACEWEKKTLTVEFRTVRSL